MKIDSRRSKSKTNKRTHNLQKRHRPTEKRWWRRNSPCPDLPPQNPPSIPFRSPDPASVDKLPNPPTSCLSPVCSEEKELFDGNPIPDVDKQDSSRIPDIAESDVQLIQYHIPVAKCSTREIRVSLTYTTNEGDRELIPDSKEDWDYNQEVDLEILKCQEALQILKEEVKRLSEEPQDKKLYQRYQRSQPEKPTPTR